MGRRPKAPIVDPDLARFIALADPSRWAMVRVLRARPRSVQEVAREVGLSLPVTSRHLQQLRAAGIVTAERRGKTLLCRLSSPDTAGGRWLARALGGPSSAPYARPRIRVRRQERPPRAERPRPERPRPERPTPARPAANAPALVPRRELDDYLL
jgi:DNA-binding transcriptional ArsR family regulator